MFLESTAFTYILSSLSVVYQAYSKIKSNRERCKQLVDRCELIVDRLKPILASDHDAPIRNRIEDLDKAFKLTADTITKVGEQSYVTSLLRTEENSAAIEDAQRALTELITILSLETLIDVSAWQRENETAVRKEFAQVKRDIQNLDQSFHQGLAGHGASLDQLSQAVHNMSSRIGETAPPSSAGSAVADIPLYEGQPRARSWSQPVGVRPSIVSILEGTAAPPLSAGSINSTPERRVANRLRSSLLAPPASCGSEARQQPRRVQFHTPVSPSPLNQSHMSIQTTPPSRQANDDEVHLDSEDPETPPPPYTALSWEDEIIAAYERMESSPTAAERPANSRSSTAAVRWQVTPMLVNESPDGYDFFNRPPENEGLLKVRESLKRKNIRNFSAMKTIGQFGKINTRVLVEMWLFPKTRVFDTAVPLASFEPTQRDKLQLIKSRAQRDNANLSPPLDARGVQPEYNHVLLLCPREAKPTVIVTDRKQSLPQQVVKAYIMDTIEPMTLVSVKQPGKNSWFLIPFYPDMRVWKAKDYIQKHFGDVLINSCTAADQLNQLDDNSTLFDNGVQAYDHKLNMEISPFSF